MLCYVMLCYVMLCYLICTGVTLSLSHIQQDDIDYIKTIVWKVPNLINNKKREENVVTKGDIASFEQ